jgi:putative ABC transport system substrate-binding protein
MSVSSTARPGVDRRTCLIAALGSAWSSGPPRAQPAVARVGWLHLRQSGAYSQLTDRGFVAGLAQAGWVEGKNLTLVQRNAAGDYRKLRPMAREIVAEKVDVFFAPAKPMADAAWYASRQVPTVIATVTDPVVVEYAVSLARPGKHITGVTTANAELIGKRLQLLTELVPGIERVGIPIDPDMVDSCEEELRLMELAAKQLKVRLVRLNPTVSRRDTDSVIREAMAEAARLRVQALITAPLSSNLDVVDTLGVAAAAARLPFVHDVPQFAHQALAVYGPDFEDIFRRAAGYVVRILQGEKPATMAIEEPRDFKLIVNAAQARLFGLTLPPRVLVRADQVIG